MQPAQPVRPVQPVPAAKKKTPVALIIVIVIVALALVGGIVTAAVLLLPRFIGGKKGGDAGYYTMKSMTEGETTYTADDFRAAGMDPTSIYILLNEDGTGTFCFDSVEPLTWEDGYLIDASGEKISYTRDGDEITLTVDYTVMVFQRSDAEPPAVSYTAYKNIDTNSDSWTSAAAQRWNGVWYGVLCVSSGTGKYADYINSLYDAYTLIYVDNYGEAVFASYIEGSELPYLSATGSADEYSFSIKDGSLFNGSLGDSDSAHAILTQSFGDNYALLSGTYTDLSGDAIEFVVYMKPYGEKWDDIAGTQTLPVPNGYNDYLANIENGYDAPYSMAQLNFDYYYAG